MCSAAAKKIIGIGMDDAKFTQDGRRGGRRAGPEGGDPPFVLLLDPPQYDDELRALIEWVEGVLVPGYLGEPSADARWCHLWFEHPVAVSRLHAA
ncbi:DUF4913 domain-containing protein [Streptomyces paradoxus]|uniref:DUF4913 domain-containing protein n=1 Tax=Streptomyces paradoxus TaxID=66375 RepID=UPI0037FC2F1E